MIQRITHGENWYNLIGIHNVQGLETLIKDQSIRSYVPKLNKKFFLFEGKLVGNFGTLNFKSKKKADEALIEATDVNGNADSIADKMRKIVFIEDLIVVRFFDSSEELRNNMFTYFNKGEVKSNRAIGIKPLVKNPEMAKRYSYQRHKTFQPSEQIRGLRTRGSMFAQRNQSGQLTDADLAKIN